jgi:hypothetical protein
MIQSRLPRRRAEGKGQECRAEASLSPSVIAQECGERDMIADIDPYLLDLLDGHGPLFDDPRRALPSNTPKPVDPATARQLFGIADGAVYHEVAPSVQRSDGGNEIGSPLVDFRLGQEGWEEIDQKVEPLVKWLHKDGGHLWRTRECKGVSNSAIDSKFELCPYGCNVADGMQ